MRLLPDASLINQFDLSKLQVILAGGMKVDGKIIDKIYANLTNIAIFAQGKMAGQQFACY
jgi:hypothetical protein